MTKWFNWICAAMFVAYILVSIVMKVPWQEAVMTYGMFAAIWVAGWVGYWIVKWLHRRIPSKFDWVPVRVVAFIIVSLTSYSCIMQILYLMFGG